MIKRLAVCALAVSALPLPGVTQTKADIRNGQVWIAFSCGQGCLWKYGPAQQSSAYQFTAPTFFLDGKQVSAAVAHFVPIGVPIHLDNGATEYAFEGTLTHDPHLQLRVQFQVNDETPVIRFRYLLKGDRPRTLTAPGGANRLTYLETSLK